LKSAPGTNLTAAESAPKSIFQPQRRLLSHSLLRRIGSLTILSSAELAPRNSQPSATAALQVFQPFRNCGSPEAPTFRRPLFLGRTFHIGRRPSLGSDAGLLSHPQRRTGDFTKPSATADAHFLQWPDRSILSRIFEIFLRRRRSGGSRVGCGIAPSSATVGG